MTISPMILDEFELKDRKGRIFHMSDIEFIKEPRYNDGLYEIIFLRWDSRFIYKIQFLSKWHAHRAREKYCELWEKYYTVTARNQNGQ